jgi:hypothetical protein
MTALQIFTSQSRFPRRLKRVCLIRVFSRIKQPGLRADVIKLATQIQTSALDAASQELDCQDTPDRGCISSPSAAKAIISQRLFGSLVLCVCMLTSQIFHA